MENYLFSRIHSILPSILPSNIEAQLAFQKCFLPQIPFMRGIEFAVFNLSASGNVVTGDFYEVKSLGNSSIGIIMGDVSGKGTNALPLATYIRSFTSARLQKDTNTGSMLSALNYVIRRKLLNKIQYATVFCGIIDGRDKTLRYSLGGHPPALLIRQGKTRWLSKGGAIVGLLPQPFYPQECISLYPGDLLVLYTDGITEADNNDKQFGLNRLSNFIEKHSHNMNPEQLAEQVFQAARDFHQGPLTDDATVIVLRID